MTTRKASSPRGRRRIGPSHATPRTRKGSLWGGLVALALLGAAGFAVVDGASGGGGAERAEPGPPPSSSRPTGSPSHETIDKPDKPDKPDIPSTGPGTFVTASGGGAKAGSGTVLRYRVEVEDGLDVSAADAARQVERILADPRGWTADGHSAFQRVSSGASDFVVRIATPGTVDEICGQHGLDTHGEYNCNVANNVMVNLKRWLLATPVYAEDIPSYRALIINHEVGHFLGHGHVDCPGPGQPAPAMMQQIKGMHGCVPNVWPYDEHGRYVTGPTVP